MSKRDATQYGGQAIVEGVMMRSRHHYAVAVRAPNGLILLEDEPLAKSWLFRQKWLMRPFLRGTFALLDAMSLGIKAMNFGAKIQVDPRYLPEGVSPDTKETHYGEAPADGPSRVERSTGESQSALKTEHVGMAMATGIALGLLLFVFLPNLSAEPLKRLGLNPIALNFVSGLIKVVFFLGYIWLIGRMEAIRRVFQYHGAEHKAINALEHGEPLTVEACLRQSRLHPRCGTSFAIVVLVVSILAFTFIPRYLIAEWAAFPNLLLRFLIELMLLPIIAGIAFELIRTAGKFRNQRWVSILFWPGLQTQYLTTVEPDRSQQEVAIVALVAVLQAEGAEVETDTAPLSEPEPAAEPTTASEPEPAKGPAS